MQRTKTAQLTCSPPTQYARQLHAALTFVGVAAVLEHPDGHKCVDIYVPNAKLYIEVDGSQHYTEADQILIDFRRDYYSDKEGFRTLRLTNQAVVSQSMKIARAIKKITNIIPK